MLCGVMLPFWDVNRNRFVMAGKTYAEHKRELEKIDAEHKASIIGVVAALPGWYIIDFLSNSDETFLTPIVAWELVTYAEETTANPVSYEARVSGMTWAIVAPDGSVAAPNTCSWPDVAAYVRSHIEDRERKHV